MVAIRWLSVSEKLNSPSKQTMVRHCDWSPFAGWTAAISPQRAAIHARTVSGKVPDLGWGMIRKQRHVNLAKQSRGFSNAITRSNQSSSLRIYCFCKNKTAVMTSIVRVSEALWIFAHAKVTRPFHSCTRALQTLSLDMNWIENLLDIWLGSRKEALGCAMFVKFFSL